MKRQLIFAALPMILPGMASAAIVVSQVSANNGTDNLPNPYTASSTDLLNGLTPTTIVGNFAQEGTGGVPILTDGQTPAVVSRVQANPTGFQFASFATGGNTGGTQLIYTLPTARSLASITILGGWQDGGRDEQSFSISYSVATAPTTFLPLVTVDYNPTDSTPVPTGASGNTHPTLTRITFTDTSGTLAGNVAQIKFDFNTTENGYSGYSEIDVQAVPEPSAAGLLGLAGMALALRRRRQA